MSDSTPTVPLHLVGLPLDVHRRYGEHQEALRRELAFVEHARDPEAAPARLHALTLELRGRYGGLMQAQAAQLEEALAARQPTIDLDFDLPPDIVDATAHLGALLDELDAFCRDGDLLTLVTPPDLVAYRRWFLSELEQQIRHQRPPTPWPLATRGAVSEPSDTSPNGSSPGVRVTVDDDLDLATAPALRQVLVGHIEDGVTHITLDLSACEFLDSTGLSLLVTTHRRLLEAGGGLRLAGAGGQVRGILDMAGTNDFFGQD